MAELRSKNGRLIWAESFKTVSELRLHASDYHNSKFFTKAAMQFFDSRLGSKVYGTDNKWIWLFVTSEMQWEQKRDWTVRKYDMRTGEIGNVVEGLTSNSQADRVARRCTQKMSFADDMSAPDPVPVPTKRQVIPAWRPF